MKKLIIFFLVLSILISFVSAQTTTLNFINNSSTKFNFQFNKNKNLKYVNRSTSTKNELSSKPLKNNKKEKNSKTKQSSEKYKICVSQKIKNLTTIMQTKKKEAFDDYRQLAKNTTSTKILKESYAAKIKEINRWFNEEVKKVKEECQVNILAPFSTSTNSTSTTSSIERF